MIRNKDSDFILKLPNVEGKQCLLEVKKNSFGKWEVRRRLRLTSQAWLSEIAENGLVTVNNSPITGRSFLLPDKAIFSIAGRNFGIAYNQKASSSTTSSVNRTGKISSSTPTVGSSDTEQLPTRNLQKLETTTASKPQPKTWETESNGDTSSDMMEKQDSSDTDTQDHSLSNSGKKRHSQHSEDQLHSKHTKYTTETVETILKSMHYDEWEQHIYNVLCAKQSGVSSQSILKELARISNPCPTPQMVTQILLDSNKFVPTGTCDETGYHWEVIKS